LEAHQTDSFTFELEKSLSGSTSSFFRPHVFAEEDPGGEDPDETLGGSKGGLESPLMKNKEIVFSSEVPD
jgi:hypothetical protein